MPNLSVASFPVSFNSELDVSIPSQWIIWSSLERREWVVCDSIRHCEKEHRYSPIPVLIPSINSIAPELALIVDSLLDLANKYVNRPSDETFQNLKDAVMNLCPTKEDANVEKCSDLLTVARVFHEFLILAEVCERQHRIRRWRAYRRGESELFFKQTCNDAFKLLIEKGFEPEQIREALMKQRVELVLTAHPTQAARRTLLEKYFK